MFTYHSTRLKTLAIYGGRLGQSNLFDIMPNLSIIQGLETLLNSSTEDYWLVKQELRPAGGVVYLHAMDMNGLANSGQVQTGTSWITTRSSW